MNADELRALQAPLKQKYKTDPSTAVVTLHAFGSIDGADVSCHIKTGLGEGVAGLHPAAGGNGKELCSGDMLLEALAACAGVTLKAVATATGIELRSATVQADGDLDFRGTLGVAKDAPVGFKEIRLRFEIDSDATQEKLDQLLRLSERYCVVYQTLKAGVPIHMSWQRP